MKKRTLVLILILAALLTGGIGFTVGYAVTQKHCDEQPNYYANKLTSPPLPNKISFAGEEVPMDVYWVREALDRELVVNCYQHSKTIRIMKLSARVFPVVERILKEEGVPDDLKYLCVAESGLENVTSPAGAGGYWQFMASTAKVYGLEISNDVDERCHLEKATRAACKYLKKCKNQFGSWSLAAAAYNRGEGGLAAAIEDQNCHNFWDLWLNSETSRYLYRIISFKLIFENPQLYGVEMCPAEQYLPVACREVKVTASIPSLPKYAQEQGVTYRELRNLNPWIKNNKLTVAAGKSYTLLLPEKASQSHKHLLKKVENPYLKIGTPEEVNKE